MHKGIYLSVNMLLFLFNVNVWAGCEIPLVINGLKQMPTGTGQTLLNTGGQAPYTWTILSGHDGLNSHEGDSVTYTAPGSNANCLNNPTIQVTDSCGNSALLKVSIHAANLANHWALQYLSDVDLHCEWESCCICGSSRRCPIYNCDNSVAINGFCAGGPGGTLADCVGDTCPFGGCQPVCGTPPPPDLEIIWLFPYGEAYAKSQGCCPAFAAQCVAINEFRVTNSSMNSSSGVTTDFIGNISADSGSSVNWSISVGGQVINGSGNSISASWDGKDSYGKQVSTGRYNATLAVQATGGTCGDDSDTKSISITVTENQEVSEPWPACTTITLER